MAVLVRALVLSWAILTRFLAVSFVLSLFISYFLYCVAIYFNELWPYFYFLYSTYMQITLMCNICQGYKRAKASQCDHNQQHQTPFALRRTTSLLHNCDDSSI